MNLFELSAKISMDTKDYEKAMKNAVSGSKSLKENFSKLALQSETNTNKIKVLASQYDSAKSKVAVLTTAFNKAAREEGVTAERTQELAKELADAEKKADDLKNEMDSLSKKTKNTGDSVESLSDKLKKGLSTAAKVATGVLTTVASGVVALGKIGLEYNAQIESYTTDFEVMMGDAEAVARKVEELKKMGAKTPFELGDLASATKTLLAFNVSADDSTGVLQQLGDISLGNVQKLESLTRAYGKMNASQKVTLEDINMMIDAGFNPLLLVAENTGETMEEVYDRISKGGVAFEEITGAINQATSEGGQFYQGMDKASQTTQGLISTLKDAAQSKIGELFSDISEKIKELLPNVISFIENIDTDEIVAGVENLMQTFNDLLPVITGVTSATVAYKAATSIAGIIDALRKATEGQTIAQALLNAVMNANPFILIATLIAGLVSAIITLWNTNEGFRNALIGAWDAIKNAAVVVWESIVKFFTEDIPNAFNAVINFVKNNWQSLLLLITNPIAGALKLLYDLNPKFREWVDNVWQSIKNGFNKIIDGAKTWGKDLIDNFVSGIKSKISAVTSAVSGVASTVKSFLGFSEPEKGPLSNFHTYAPDMMDLFIKGIRDNEKKLTDQIEKTFDFGERTITAGISYGSYGDVGFSRGNGYGAGQVSAVQSTVRAAIHDEISKIGIYLDGNTLVGGISERIDNGLGRIYAGNERRAMA